MEFKLQNINLLAQNPPQLRDFYVKIFGLTESLRSHAPGFFMLETHSGCTLSIQDAVGVGQKVGTEGFELGFEIDDAEKLDELIGLVKESGGRVVDAGQQMAWGRAVTVADPEGHRINVYKFRGRN